MTQSEMLSDGMPVTVPDPRRAADTVRDDFLALVSHELRTPLTSIIGYLELALDEAGEMVELDAGRRHFLEVADRNAQRLLQLIDDLLVAAEASAGAGPAPLSERGRRAPAAAAPGD